jgi:hypothetical protein
VRSFGQQKSQSVRRWREGLFGIELVSHVDYWTLLAEDELDDTHDAPWASPDKRKRPEVTRRREMFRTLNHEQRETVRELLRYAVKGQLHSFCVALDQTLGGSTVVLEHPTDQHSDKLEIHSPRQEEIHHDQLQWLEDFSIVFGQDERYEKKA